MSIPSTRGCFELGIQRSFFQIEKKYLSFGPNWLAAEGPATNQKLSSLLMKNFHNKLKIQNQNDSKMQFYVRD